jgi:hypothetical protein
LAGKSHAAAFTSGDLPEAPGGEGAALSRFAMARDQLFSAAGMARVLARNLFRSVAIPALHREAK